MKNFELLNPDQTKSVEFLGCRAAELDTAEISI